MPFTISHGNVSSINASATMLPAYSIQGYVYDDISGEPVQGVSVSVGIRSAVSDSSGYYSLSDLVSGPYTLVATKPGYDFEPASNLVEIYYEDMPYYDIPAHLITYHIAGHITTSGDEGYSSEEVLISVTDPTGSRNGTTYTDENGDYTIELLPCVVNPPQQTCLLTVKVSKPGYYFATPTAHVTLSNADINNINFTGVYQPGWISGKVCRYGFRNKGDCMSVCLEDMRGVMVTGSRSDGSDEVSTYTDSDGFFRIGPFARGTTIELDPWLYGYESCETRSVYLNVAEKDIENDPLGVSFTDGVTTYRIEGYTRMAFTQACVGGVTVTLTDSNSNVIETTSFDDDINPGWYQFTGLPAGTYTLTASKPCLGLSPWSIGVTITNADATEKNFTARTQTYSIYGTVTELGGSPVAGAALSLYKNLLHLQSTVSNSSGQYSFNGLSNGRYTITIDSGCVPVFGNMSAFISCASVERNFECQSGLCESKRQEAAARLNRLKTFDGIDNKGRQADNGDMETQPDKDNPSASSLQPSSRTEASAPEYVFYHSDHLGTVRLITNNSGNVVSRHDYEPFGVEIAPVVETANNTHRFTGHERDKATGYDYMHYRSYGSNLGRFMKPDNITGNPLNPQSWNLYSYVRGNPVNFNDPTGHEEENTEQQLSKASGDKDNPLGNSTDADARKKKLEKQEQPEKVEVKVEVVTALPDDYVFGDSECLPVLREGDAIRYPEQYTAVGEFKVYTDRPSEECNDKGQGGALWDLIMMKIQTKQVVSETRTIFESPDCPGEYQLAKEASNQDPMIKTVFVGKHPVDTEPIKYKESRPLGPSTYIGPYNGKEKF
ncbi:MAG TPA: carboxypeptidase regulatory-like domain-containing protein [Acidobacteriota bacterium]|nr:carboxypeptidase regulatory-like domain-containing protein [Acidobacteriota bacterium]